MSLILLRNFYVIILPILALHFASITGVQPPGDPVKISSIKAIVVNNETKNNGNHDINLPPNKQVPESNQQSSPVKNKTSAESKTNSDSNDKKSEKPLAETPAKKLDVIDTVENPNENGFQSGVVTRGILVFVGLTFLFLLYAGLKTYRKRNRKSKRRTVVRRYAGKKYDVEMEPLPLSDEEDETIFELNGPSTSK